MSGDVADAVRITAAGHFYEAELISNFTYLDVVAADTPIKSPEWFQKLSESASNLSSAIPDRLKKVEVFLAYLNEEEVKEGPFLEEVNLPASVLSPIVPTLMASFQRERPRVFMGGATALYRRRRTPELNRESDR